MKKLILTKEFIKTIKEMGDLDKSIREIASEREEIKKELFSDFIKTYGNGVYYLTTNGVGNYPILEKLNERERINRIQEEKIKETERRPSEIITKIY